MNYKIILFQKIFPLLFGFLLIAVEITFIYYTDNLFSLLISFTVGLLWGKITYSVTKNLLSMGWLTLSSTAFPALILITLSLAFPYYLFNYELACLILSNWLSINLPCFLHRLFSRRTEANSYTKYSKLISMIFCFSYTLLMLFMLFSDSFGQRSGQRTVNLIPFNTIILYLTGFQCIGLRNIIINILGNILLFIPLGFYLKAFIKDFKANIIMIISIPIAIELTQYIFRVGSADIDDFILNVLGELIGLLILLLVNFIYHQSKKSSNDTFLGF